MKRILVTVLAFSLLSGISFASDGGKKKAKAKSTVVCSKGCPDAKGCHKGANCPKMPGCVCN